MPLSTGHGVAELFSCCSSGDHLMSAESVTTQETNSASPCDSTVKGRADHGWTRTAGWLLDLSLETPGIFRTIVGYL